MDGGAVGYPAGATAAPPAQSSITTALPGRRPRSSAAKKPVRWCVWGMQCNVGVGFFFGSYDGQVL